MKCISICLLIAAGVLISCKGKEENDKTEQQLAALEKRVSQLDDSLRSVYKAFAEPLAAYQEILLSEMNTAPDSLVARYDRLIKKYPGSLWEHEAKKRTQNIESRRNCWSEKNGWQLNKQKETKVIAPEVISCPGC